MAMETALIAQADKSRDVASALSKFIEPVADWSAEIEATIAACFSISSALRDLNAAIRTAGRSDSVVTDVRTVLRSLENTYNDVDWLFEGLGRGRYALEEVAFREVWQDIVEYFLFESQRTLCERLELCTQLIIELTRIVDGSVFSKL